MAHASAELEGSSLPCGGGDGNPLLARPLGGAMHVVCMDYFSNAWASLHKRDSEYMIGHLLWVLARAVQGL